MDGTSCYTSDLEGTCNALKNITYKQAKDICEVIIIYQYKHFTKSVETILTFYAFFYFSEPPSRIPSFLNLFLVLLL